MTARPQRLQRRRVKGYDMQAESRRLNGLSARACTRPGRYANPFVPGPLGEAKVLQANGMARFLARPLSVAGAVALFRVRLATLLRADPEFLEPLRGFNLACFCALDAPHCHVDVLLDRANR